MIALAIPISIIGAVVVLVAMGRSINIISLAGMAFAVGMVVDNAIVVIENIYRHLEMGRPARAAAADGTREVAGAVVASTITTIAVFLPILFIEETAGQLFKDIAYAIIAAVALSLVVSLTVIPTAAARALRREPPPQGPDADRSKFAFLAKLHALVNALPERVARLIGWINRSWSARLTVIAIFTLGAPLGIKVLLTDLDYLPRGNRNLIFGLLTLHPIITLRNWTPSENALKPPSGRPGSPLPIASRPRQSCVNVRVAPVSRENPFPPTRERSPPSPRLR